MAASRVRQAFLEGESEEDVPSTEVTQKQVRRKPDSSGDAVASRAAASHRQTHNMTGGRGKQHGFSRLDDPGDLRPTTPPTGPSSRGRQPDWASAVLQMLQGSSMNAHTTSADDMPQPAAQMTDTGKLRRHASAATGAAVTRPPTLGPASSFAKVAAARTLNNSSSDEDDASADASEQLLKEASAGSLELKAPATVVAAQRGVRSSRLSSSSAAPSAAGDATSTSSWLASSSHRISAAGPFAATAAAAFEGLHSHIQAVPANPHRQQQRAARQQRLTSNVSVSSNASQPESLASSRMTFGSSRLSASVQRVVARQRLMDSSSGEEDATQQPQLQASDPAPAATLTAMFARSKPMPASASGAAGEHVGTGPRKSPAAAVSMIAPLKGKSSSSRRHASAHSAAAQGEQGPDSVEHGVFSFHAAQNTGGSGSRDGPSDGISPRMRQVTAAASAEVAAAAADSMRPLPLSAIVPAQLHSPVRPTTAVAPPGALVAEESAHSQVSSSQRVTSWLEQQPSMSTISNLDDFTSEYATTVAGTEAAPSRKGTSTALLLAATPAHKAADSTGLVWASEHMSDGEAEVPGLGGDDAVLSARMRAVRLSVSSDDDERREAVRSRRTVAPPSGVAVTSSANSEGRRTEHSGPASPPDHHTAVARTAKERPSSYSSPSFRLSDDSSAASPAKVRGLTQNLPAAPTPRLVGSLASGPSASPQRPQRKEPDLETHGSDASALVRSGGGSHRHAAPASPGSRLTPSELRLMLSVLARPPTGSSEAATADGSSVSGALSTGPSVSGDSVKSLSYSEMLQFVRAVSSAGGNLAGLSLPPPSNGTGGSVISSSSADRPRKASAGTPLTGTASAREPSAGSASPPPVPPTQSPLRPPRGGSPSPQKRAAAPMPNAGVSVGGNSSLLEEHPLAAPPPMRDWSASGSITSSRLTREERQQGKHRQHHPQQHDQPDFTEMLRLWTAITGRQISPSAFTEPLDPAGAPGNSALLSTGTGGSVMPRRTSTASLAPGSAAAGSRPTSPPSAAVLAASAAAMATSAVIAATTGGQHHHHALQPFHAAFAQTFAHASVAASRQSSPHSQQPQSPQQQRQRSPPPATAAAAAAKGRIASDLASLPAKSSPAASPGRATPAAAAAASPSRGAPLPSQPRPDDPASSPADSETPAVDVARLLRLLRAADHKREHRRHRHRHRPAKEQEGARESGSESGASPGTELASMQTDLQRLIRMVSAAGHNEVLPSTVAQDAKSDLKHLVRLLNMAGSPRSEEARSARQHRRTADSKGSMASPHRAVTTATTSADSKAALQTSPPRATAATAKTPATAVSAADLPPKAVPSQEKGVPASAAPFASAGDAVTAQPSRRSSADTVETGLALSHLHNALRNLRVRDEGGQTESPTLASDGVQTEAAELISFAVAGASASGGRPSWPAPLSNQASTATNLAGRSRAASTEPAPLAAGITAPAVLAAPADRVSESVGSIKVTRALKLPTGQLVELDPLLKLLSDESALEQATRGLEGAGSQAVQDIRALVETLGGAAPPTISEVFPAHQLRALRSNSRVFAGAPPAFGSSDALATSLRSMASSDLDGFHAGGAVRRTDVSAAPSRSTVDGGVQTDLTALDMAAVLAAPPPAQSQGSSTAADSADGPGTSITAAPAVPPVLAPAGTGEAREAEARDMPPTRSPGDALGSFPMRNLPIASEGGIMEAPNQEAVSAGRVGSAGGMLAFLEAADPTTATALLELVQALQLMTLHSRRRRWVSDGSSTVSGTYYVEPPPGGYVGNLYRESSGAVMDLRCSFVTSIGPSVSQAGQPSFTDLPAAPTEATEGGAGQATQTHPPLPRQSQNTGAALPPRPTAPAPTPADADLTAVHLRRALRAVSGGGTPRPPCGSGRRSSSGSAASGNKMGAGVPHAPSPAAEAPVPPGTMTTAAGAEVHIARALELLTPYNVGHPLDAATAAAAAEAELCAQEELVAALLALLTSSSHNAVRSSQVPATEHTASEQAGCGSATVAREATQQQQRQEAADGSASSISLGDGCTQPAANQDVPPNVVSEVSAQEPDQLTGAIASAAAEDAARQSDATAEAADDVEEHVSPSAALHARIQMVLEQAERASANISSLQVGLSPTRADAAEALEGVPFEQAIGFIMDGLRDFDGGPAHLARHLHLLYPPSVGGAPLRSSPASSSRTSRRQSAVAAALEAAAAGMESVPDPVAERTGDADAGDEVSPLSQEERDRVQTLISAALAAAEAVACRFGNPSHAEAETTAGVEAETGAAPATGLVDVLSYPTSSSVQVEESAEAVPPLDQQLPQVLAPQMLAQTRVAPTAAQLPAPSLALAIASSRGGSPARLGRSAGAVGSSGTSTVSNSTSWFASSSAAGRFDDAAPLRPSSGILEALEGLTPVVSIAVETAAVAPSSDTTGEAPEELAWSLSEEYATRPASGAGSQQRSAPVTSGGMTPGDWAGPEQDPHGNAAGVAASSQTFGGAMELPADQVVQQQQHGAPYLPYGNLDERLMPVETAGMEEPEPIAVWRPRLPTFAMPSAPAVRSTAVVMRTLFLDEGDAQQAAPAQGQGCGEGADGLRGAESLHACADDGEQALPQTQEMMVQPLVRSAPVTLAGDAQPLVSRPPHTTGGMPSDPALPSNAALDPEVPALTAKDRFKAPTPVSGSPYKHSESPSVQPSAWSPPTSDGKTTPPPAVRLARDIMTGQRASQSLIPEDAAASIPALPDTSAAPSSDTAALPAASPTGASGDGARRALFASVEGDPVPEPRAGPSAESSEGDGCSNGEEASAVPVVGDNDKDGEAVAPKELLLTQAAQLLLQAMRRAAEGQPEQEAALQILSPVLQGLAGAGASVAEPQSEAQQDSGGVALLAAQDPIGQQQQQECGDAEEEDKEEGGKEEEQAAAARLHVQVVVDGGLEAPLQPLEDAPAASFTFGEGVAPAVATPSASTPPGSSASASAPQPLEQGPQTQQQQPHVATAADLESFKEDVMSSVRSALLEIVDMIGSTVVQRAAATAAAGSAVSTSQTAPAAASDSSGSTDLQSSASGSSASDDSTGGCGPASEAGVAGAVEPATGSEEQQEIRITRAELEAFMFGKAVLSSTASNELLGVRLRDLYSSQRAQEQQRPSEVSEGTASGSSDDGYAAQPHQQAPSQEGDDSSSDSLPPMDPDNDRGGSPTEFGVAPAERHRPKAPAPASEPGAGVPRNSPLRRPMGDNADFKSLFRRSMEHLRGHLQAHQHPHSVLRTSASATAAAGWSGSPSRSPSPAPDAIGAADEATATMCPPPLSAQEGQPAIGPQLDLLEASLGPTVPPSLVQRTAGSAVVLDPITVDLEASARADDDVELEPYLSGGRQPEPTTHVSRLPDPAAPATQHPTHVFQPADALSGAAPLRAASAARRALVSPAAPASGAPGTEAEGQAIGDFLAALAEPVVQVVGLFASQPGGSGVRQTFPQRTVVIEELSADAPPESDQREFDAWWQQQQLPARPSRVPGHVASSLPGGVPWDEDDAEGSDIDDGFGDMPRASSAANTPRLRLRHPTIDQVLDQNPPQLSRSASSTPAGRSAFSLATGAAAAAAATAGIDATGEADVPYSQAVQPHSTQVPPQRHSIVAMPGSSRLKMVSSPGMAPGGSLAAEDRPLSSFHGSSDLLTGAAASPPRRRTVSPGRSRRQVALISSLRREGSVAPAVASGALVGAETALAFRSVDTQSAANKSLEELESYLRDFKSKIGSDGGDGAFGLVEQQHEQPRLLLGAPMGGVSVVVAAAAAIPGAVERPQEDEDERHKRVLSPVLQADEYSADELQDAGFANVTLGKTDSVLTGFNMFTIRASAASALAAAAAVEQAFSPRQCREPEAVVADTTEDRQSRAAAAGLALAPSEAETQQGLQPEVVPAASVSRSSGGGSAGPSASAMSRDSSAHATPTNPLLREHLEHFQALLEKANDLVDRLMLADDEDVSEGGAPESSALMSSARDATPLSAGGGSSRRQLIYRLGPHRSAAGALQLTPSRQANTPRSKAVGRADAGMSTPASFTDEVPTPAVATATTTPGVEVDGTAVLTPLSTPSLDPELAALFPATAARLARPHAHVEQSPDAANSLVSSALSALPQLAAGAGRARSLSSSPSRSPADSVGEISVANHNAEASASVGTPTAAPTATAAGAVATPLALMAALLAEAHTRMEFRSLDEQRGADRILSAVLDEHFAHVLGTPRGFLTPPRGMLAARIAAADAVATPEAAAVATPKTAPKTALPPHVAPAQQQGQAPASDPAVGCPSGAIGSNNLSSAFGKAVSITAAAEVTAADAEVVAAIATTVPAAPAAAAPAASLPWEATTSSSSAVITAMEEQQSQPQQELRHAARDDGDTRPATAAAPLPESLLAADVFSNSTQHARPHLPPAEAQAQAPLPPTHLQPAHDGELTEFLSRVMQQRSDLLTSALDQVQRVAAAPASSAPTAESSALMPPPAVPQPSTVAAASIDNTLPPCSAADLFAASALMGGALPPMAQLPTSTAASPRGASADPALSGPQLPHPLVSGVLPSLLVPATSGLQQPQPQPLMPYSESESGRTSYNVSLASSARHYYYDSPAWSTGPSPRGTATVMPGDATAATAAAALLSRRLAATSSGGPSAGATLIAADALPTAAIGDGAVASVTMPYDLTHLLDEDSGLSSGRSTVFYSSAGGYPHGISLRASGPVRSPAGGHGAGPDLLREAAIRYNPVYDPEGSSSPLGGAAGPFGLATPGGPVTPFYVSGRGGGAASTGGATMATLHHETAYTPLAEAASVAQSDGGASISSPPHARLRSAGGTTTAVLVPNPAFEPHDENTRVRTPMPGAAVALPSAVVASGLLATLPTTSSDLLSDPSSMSSIGGGLAPSADLAPVLARLQLQSSDSVGPAAAAALTAAVGTGQGLYSISSSGSGPTVLPLSPVVELLAATAAGSLSPSAQHQLGLNGDTASARGTVGRLAASSGGGMGPSSSRSHALLGSPPDIADSSDLMSLLQSSLTESQLNLLAAAPELPVSRRQSHTSTSQLSTARTVMTALQRSGGGAAAVQPVSLAAAAAAAAAVMRPSQAGGEVGLVSVDFDEISREAAEVVDTLSQGPQAQAPQQQGEETKDTEMAKAQQSHGTVSAGTTGATSSQAASTTATPRRPKSGGLVAAAVRMFESGGAQAPTGTEDNIDVNSRPAPPAAPSPAPLQLSVLSIGAPAAADGPKSPKPVFKPASRAMSGIPRAAPSPGGPLGGVSPADSRRHSDSSVAEERTSSLLPGAGADALLAATAAVASEQAELAQEEQQQPEAAAGAAKSLAAELEAAAAADEATALDDAAGPAVAGVDVAADALFGLMGVGLGLDDSGVFASGTPSLSASASVEHLLAAGVPSRSTSRSQSQSVTAIGRASRGSGMPQGDLGLPAVPSPLGLTPELGEALSEVELTSSVSAGMEVFGMESEGALQAAVGSVGAVAEGAGDAGSTVLTREWVPSSSSEVMLPAEGGDNVSAVQLQAQAEPLPLRDPSPARTTSASAAPAARPVSNPGLRPASRSASPAPVRRVGANTTGGTAASPTKPRSVSSGSPGWVTSTRLSGHSRLLSSSSGSTSTSAQPARAQSGAAALALARANRQSSPAHSRIPGSSIGDGGSPGGGGGNRSSSPAVRGAASESVGGGGAGRRVSQSPARVGTRPSAVAGRASTPGGRLASSSSGSANLQAQEQRRQQQEEVQLQGSSSVEDDEGVEAGAQGGQEQVPLHEAVRAYRNSRRPSQVM